ncbi:MULTISPECIES: EamA family transporter [Azospirillum]|nr:MULTISPECIES: EamA family transporter [Azospirillum]MDW7555422.1 EamA family transporter [Azospirillum brasilense]MDW7595170.1 EamA family transporter [Azospirillum brasilense]MDW7630323.1 EamA family transporter [Azospirillum brasilense]MDX5949691.1 EamA family transporter [Azospirillum brasilense]TVZ67445.1 threonine/homoserine efflux transporter RhtA [Azospirillum brasilense]
MRAASSPLTAVSWAAVSAVAFSSGAAAAKFLSVKLPPAELAFIRAALAAVAIAGLWRYATRIREARDLGWHAIRLVLGVVAGYSFMHAITLAPIALVSLIYFSRVLLVPVAARFMLGERAGWAIWAGAALGTVGVVVSAGGAPSVDLGLGAAIAALAAISSAGSQVAVRRLTASNDPALIVLIFSIGSALALGPAAAALWVQPTIPDIPVLVAIGAFAVVAQFAAAKAFAAAPAPFVAPFDFLTVPASAAAGAVLFGEVPGLEMVAGGALVIAGAALVASLGKTGR